MATNRKGANFRITASDETRSAFKGVQNNINRTAGLQKSWNKGLNANRRAVQQFGFQMTDFATQIAGGQDAMLAFTQQGGQMLQFFGPFGAIMAAFLAVFGSMFIAMTKTGTAFSSITPIMGVLEDEFVALGAVLKNVGTFFIDFANVVINNLDRILITAGLVAGFFIGRWVFGMIAAKLATMTFASALLFLRGALIRTGIGALIVGLGEVVFLFTKLVKGAGNIGNAMVLLGDVANEVFSRIVSRVEFLSVGFSQMSNQIQFFFTKALQNMLISFFSFANSVNEGLNDMFDLDLPTDIGGGTLSGIQGSLNKLDVEFDKLISREEALQKLFDSPLKSLDALMAALRAADKTGNDIDIRDWFGGSKGKDGGSGKLSEEAKKIEKVFKDMSDSVSGSLKKAFGSLLDKTKSVKEIVSDMLIEILNKVATAALDPIWDAIGKGFSGITIGKPVSGGFEGGFFSNLFSNLMSFDGGGSTGSGARSGGMDGKGGMLAMVHPNETVTDHSKGGATGDRPLEVHIHENASTSGANEVRQSNGRVDVFLRRAVNDVIATGGADQGMRSRFGSRPQAAGG